MLQVRNITWDSARLPFSTMQSSFQTLVVWAWLQGAPPTLCHCGQLELKISRLIRKVLWLSLSGSQLWIWWSAPLPLSPGWLRLLILSCSRQKSPFMGADRLKRWMLPCVSFVYSHSLCLKVLPLLPSQNQQIVFYFSSPHLHYASALHRLTSTFLPEANSMRTYGLTMVCEIL